MQKPALSLLRAALLCSGSALALSLSAPANAQEDVPPPVEEETRSLGTITVTATRREESAQEIPLNIAAIGGEQIAEQGLDELADVLRLVPGINLVDRGGRQGNPIIVRGLNVEAIGSGDGNNDGGGTVATYLGDIPVFVDLKLNDLERVEVLLGPQGTLYGAGTLGGAIRYIPTKPKFDEVSGELRAEAYGYSEAESLSYGIGGTFNLGISDKLAFRASLDVLDDSGFIDYVNVVDQVGVTNPNTPDGLRKVEDADGEETVSGRAALRYKPTDWLDGTLTYYYQNADIGGRRTSHHRDIVPGLLAGTPSVGKYENAKAVLEPNEITNELLALEVTADLGFAELTSASGWSKFEDDGQRDQSSLLITLEYSYEIFPSFTSFTREIGETETFTQELRLVSQNDGPFNWILGGFYNKLESAGSSSEFTPNFVPFVNAPGLEFGYTDRPDALEYFSTSRDELEETALFGEISYEFFDQLTVTLGTRYYNYDLQSVSTVDFPHFLDASYTPASLSEIQNFAFDPDLAQSEDGFLYKANVSWQATDDVLVYGTISEGYRIGGVNGVGECDEFDPTGLNQQGACALAPGQAFFPGGPDDISTRDERQFLPDETRNYEIGVKSTLADGSLILNGAVYYIDWIDPQLGSATVNANIPITVNGEGASATGVELSSNWQVNDALNLQAAFSYIDAQLTDPVPDLIRLIEPPGFSSGFDDGEDGDRLPGSPETQFSIYGSYDKPLSNGSNLNFSGGYVWQGDILLSTAGKGNSHVLDSYGTANVAVAYEANNWTATFFVNNLFDEFAETGSIGGPNFNQTVTDFDGGVVYPRAFHTHILPPRAIGIRVNYRFNQND